MDPQNTIHQIWGLIEPHLIEQGLELVELEFVQEGHGYVLRIYIDKDGGITLDDCQAASQLLNPLLDDCDTLDSRYMLELSSPGIDRPVRKPEDFKRFEGESVKAVALSPVMGRKRFTGSLLGLQDDMVSIDCDGEIYEIHLENLKKCHLNR